MTTYRHILRGLIKLRWPCTPLRLLTCLIFTVSVSAAVGSELEDPALDRLFALLRERLELADTVASVKWQSQRPVEDRDRENALIDSVTKASTSRHLDPVWARAVFMDQMEASKEVQYALLESWRNAANPGHTATSLSELRHHLDALTDAILDALAANEGFRFTSDCVPIRARVIRRVSGGLDDIHEHALHRAADSLCSRSD